MKLGTHMLSGERRKPIDIEDRRTKVKVTTVLKKLCGNEKSIKILFYF
jgi:hypothetical protein